MQAQAKNNFIFCTHVNFYTKDFFKNELYINKCLFFLKIFFYMHNA